MVYCAAGGVLLVVAFYTTGSGEYIGSTEGGNNVYQTMHSIWKQLYREGRISKVKK